MKSVLALLLLAPPLACASGGMASVGTRAPGASVSAVAAGAGSATERDRLLAGHALFQSRCQRCHALPAPSRMSPEAWPGEVAGMSRKSGLSADQLALVSDYLVAASRLSTRAN